MDSETFLGAILIAGWAAVVLRGLARTVLAARKGRKWQQAYLVGSGVGCALGVGVMLSINWIISHHNNSGPHDLDVSVHFNASNGQGHGCEVFFGSPEQLAADVSAAIAKAGHLTNRVACGDKSGGKLAWSSVFAHDSGDSATLNRARDCVPPTRPIPGRGTG
jgi:hypothetical protein